MSSSTGHGFVSFVETDTVRVDVLEATYDEQRTRRNRRPGQNVRDARAEMNKEKMKYDPVHVGQLGAHAYKPEVRFPVLEGDVETLRQGLRRRPLPPGLHERPLQPGLQPEEEGTSFFTHGDFEQSEIPVDTKVGGSSQEEKPFQYEGSEQSEESSADMLTHIPTVDSGMRYILQAQDSSLRTLNNQSVLRRLSSSCTIMDGIPNLQSSTLSKKVMSPC